MLLLALATSMKVLMFHNKSVHACVPVKYSLCAMAACDAILLLVYVSCCSEVCKQTQYVLMGSLPCVCFVTVLGYFTAMGLLELYRTLKSPWKLSGWTFQGGDPCGGGGERGPWHGVFCKGSSVVAM